MADLIRCAVVLLACAGWPVVAIVRAERLADADDRVLQLEERLRNADERTSVEYGARQCMVTVARGDYDDFLRQLGWQRGGAR